MQKKLTILDIARYCQVGKSTVSRVINNESGVSDKTREKVNQAIEKLNFKPSNAARSMRTQNDRIVAIIVTRLSSISENEAVKSMLPLFYQNGYDPIVMESNFDADLVEEHLSNLQNRNISGVVLFSFTGLRTENLSQWKEKLILCARPDPELVSISYDDKEAVKILMAELLKQGHKQISFLGVEDSDTTTGLYRHHAYLEFCQANQLIANSVQTGLTYQEGYTHIADIIQPATTAVVCASDSLALGAYKYIEQLKDSNIQIASIGNSPLLNFLHPEAISVDFGYHKAGGLAAEQLMRLITHGKVENTSMVISPSLFSN